MWKRKKSDTNCQNEENDNKNKKQYELKISTSKICLWQNFQRNFENFTGFQIDELTTFKKFVKLLYRPTDPSSLGVTRALFGKIT